MTSPHGDPREQLQYQVRFDAGSVGAEHLAAADLLVWADQLGLAEPPDGAVIATVAGAPAIAELVLGLQTDRGDRVSVAVVTAADRFAAPDVLAAGAVIDALGTAGIDHCSPEAAVVGAAYHSLRHATRHLVTASVASRIQRESGSSA